MSIFRNLIGAQKKGGILPVGYTQLEYIESTGSQYIDIGILIRDTLTATADAMFTKVDNFYCLFGRLGSSRFYVGTLSGKYNLGYNLNSMSTEYAEAYKKIHIELSASPKNSILLIDESVITSNRDTDGENTLQVFKATTYSHARIYNFKAYINDLTIELLPCINPSNEVGMYDLVSQQFFGNSGTGEFIAGPVIA